MMSEASFDSTVSPVSDVVSVPPRSSGQEHQVLEQRAQVGARLAMAHQIGKLTAGKLHRRGSVLLYRKPASHCCRRRRRSAPFEVVDRLEHRYVRAQRGEMPEQPRELTV